jgi:hypothetical protein
MFILMKNGVYVDIVKETERIKQTRCGWEEIPNTGKLPDWETAKEAAKKCIRQHGLQPFWPIDAPK